MLEVSISSFLTWLSSILIESTIGIPAFKYVDNSDEFSMGKYVTVSDDYSVITLTLPPEITNQFSTTGFEECDEYDLINFEVAIRLEVGVENPDANDPVLIEPQYLIGVKDSLYSNVLSENHF